MKSLCLSLFSVAILFLSACSDLERSGPPNIVFIMADDLGYEGLSCNGSLSYSTPNLDKLAIDGMRFTHCYSQPVCTPTRVQIMTGRYNFRNYKQFGFLDLKEKTFGHYLHEAGYTNCIAGKWQLGNGIEAPFLEGFDEYCLWQIYNNVAGEDMRGSRYADPKLYRNGEVINNTAGKFGPDLCTEFVLDFMEANQSEPFFVYYPMILTHDPFIPTPDTEDWDIDPFAKDTSYFRNMLEYTDKLVATIRNKIEELGLTNDTYLFFTGDNGTSRAIYTHTDIGIVRGGKSLTHEYGIHVPFIAYSPGEIAAGSVSSTLVDFTDILPTFCDIAGIEIPKKRVLDGSSILPVLNGESSSGREYIYGYYWTRGRDPLNVKEYVRTADYKYYRSGELFDPVRDPEELNPILTDDKGELLDLLEGYLNEVRPVKK
ncbi:MAG: sulfatase-like hydrolase/transferase [Bacteroidetes bacterium]|jgi:arylsulfatase A|nr:sulfatase-like hydrolase/transferase [Bacteroidota bacterium]MBT4410279.1 sulfatase-like hydrolase/transferase [Bacteroidota bacterium]MBT7093147.1 sulfatase-like hydrolase/transferase [Bacteroidota bacterium]